MNRRCNLHDPARRCAFLPWAGWMILVKWEQSR